jgi:hypothetical protein
MFEYQRSRRGKKKAVVDISSWKQFPRDYPVAVQFPSSILAKLVQDPSLRNCFETGTSKGSNSFQNRIMWEDRLFHYTAHTIPKSRPKYGFLYGVNNVSMSFGDCLMIMNHSIREKCTVTLGDSSRATEAFDLEANPFTPIQENGKTTLNCGRFDNYIEVQIHLDNIPLKRYVKTLLVSTDLHNKKDFQAQILEFAKVLDCKLEWRERF